MTPYEQAGGVRFSVVIAYRQLSVGHCPGRDAGAETLRLTGLTPVRGAKGIGKSDSGLEIVPTGALTQGH